MKTHARTLRQSRPSVDHAEVPADKPSGVKQGERSRGHKGKGRKTTDDDYDRTARSFYDSSASVVIETVYRRPRVYANLHEYDEDPEVDNVPTAVGFHSMDSAEDIVAAKSKANRYDWEEIKGPEPKLVPDPEPKLVSEPEPKEESIPEPLAGAEASQPEASQLDASQLEASQLEASQPEASQPEASKPDASQPEDSVEISEQTQSEADAVLVEEAVEQEEEDQATVDDDLRYGPIDEDFANVSTTPKGLKSVRSDGSDSYPAVWKNESQEEDHDRAWMIAQTKRARELNSVKVPQKMLYEYDKSQIVRQFKTEEDVKAAKRSFLRRLVGGSGLAKKKQCYSTKDNKKSVIQKQAQISLPTKTNAERVETKVAKSRNSTLPTKTRAEKLETKEKKSPNSAIIPESRDPEQTPRRQRDADGKKEGGENTRYIGREPDQKIEAKSTDVGEKSSTLASQKELKPEGTESKVVSKAIPGKADAVSKQSNEGTAARGEKSVAEPEAELATQPVKEPRDSDQFCDENDESEDESTMMDLGLFDSFLKNFDALANIGMNLPAWDFFDWSGEEKAIAELESDRSESSAKKVAQQTKLTKRLLSKDDIKARLLEEKKLQRQRSRGRSEGGDVEGKGPSITSKHDESVQNESRQGSVQVKALSLDIAPGRVEQKSMPSLQRLFFQKKSLAKKSSPRKAPQQTSSRGKKGIAISSIVIPTPKSSRKQESNADDDDDDDSEVSILGLERETEKVVRTKN